MHPILWTMGPVQVRSYGLLLAVSFVLGIALALYSARQARLDTYLVSNVCLLSLFASIIGSRLLYVWENRAMYEGSAFRTLTIWEGGLSMLGGVVLAIAVTAVYVTAKGVSFRLVGDVLAPSVALGLFLTRIGCFLNGCCFGTVCDLPWAVTFPRGTHAGDQFPGLHVHPTQLYSSAFGLALFGVLLTVEKCRKGPGYLSGWFLVLYGVGRFLVEFVRFGDPSLVAFTVAHVMVTGYQLIALALVALGAYFVVTARGQRSAVGS